MIKADEPAISPNRLKAEQAAAACGVTPYSDMYLFVVQAAEYALDKAAEEPQVAVERPAVGTPAWFDMAEKAEWAFMVKMLNEAIEYIKPVNLSGLGVARDIAKARAINGWRGYGKTE